MLEAAEWMDKFTITGVRPSGYSSQSEDDKDTWESQGKEVHRGPRAVLILKQY